MHHARIVIEYEWDEWRDHLSERSKITGEERGKDQRSGEETSLWLIISVSMSSYAKELIRSAAILRTNGCCKEQCYRIVILTLVSHIEMKPLEVDSVWAMYWVSIFFHLSNFSYPVFLARALFAKPFRASLYRQSLTLSLSADVAWSIRNLARYSSPFHSSSNINQQNRGAARISQWPVISNFGRMQSSFFRFHLFPRLESKEECVWNVKGSEISKQRSDLAIRCAHHGTFYLQTHRWLYKKIHFLGHPSVDFGITKEEREEWRKYSLPSLRNLSDTCIRWSPILSLPTAIKIEQLISSMLLQLMAITDVFDWKNK